MLQEQTVAIGTQLSWYYTSLIHKAVVNQIYEGDEETVQAYEFLAEMMVRNRVFIMLLDEPGSPPETPVEEPRIKRTPRRWWGKRK